MQDNMIIKGARQHNLKNINLEIPRNKLVVITGVSGSGKSSLAFDTIYAEGQRRYVESLSAYARQFLGKMDKPDVDYIEGLSPAISIDQKTAGRNPRSTVGTVTEIYDYLRLLFARAGEPHCPKCGRLIERQTPQQIVDQVLALPEETKFIIMAPLVYGRKGEHKDILDNMRSAGYVRVLVDGAIRTLDEDIRLDKKKKHRISVVIDRMKVRDGIRQRLSDSVETALKLSDGLVEILLPGTGKNGGPDEVRVYSERFACPDCGISLPEIEPRLFSFNAPYGACPTCGGLGVNMEYDWDRIMPDKEKSFRDGAIEALSSNPASFNMRHLTAVLQKWGYTVDNCWNDLSPEDQEMLQYGAGTQGRRHPHPEAEIPRSLGRCHARRPGNLHERQHLPFLPWQPPETRSAVHPRRRQEHRRGDPHDRAGLPRLFRHGATDGTTADHCEAGVEGNQRPPQLFK